jgi:tetratricopeptide (TPR) repeat protein
MSDLNKSLEINPNYGRAYYNRAINYFLQKEYDNAWADLHKAETLGIVDDTNLTSDLKKASGRDQ